MGKLDGNLKHVCNMCYFHHYLGKDLFLCGNQVVSKENLTPKRPENHHET